MAAFDISVLLKFMTQGEDKLKTAGDNLSRLSDGYKKDLEYFNKNRSKLGDFYKGMLDEANREATKGFAKLGLGMREGMAGAILKATENQTVFQRMTGYYGDMGGRLGTSLAGGLIANVENAMSGPRITQSLVQFQDRWQAALTQAQTKFAQSKANLLPYAIGSAAIIATPLVPGARQEADSSKIQMITGMGADGRAYFDDQMRLITRSSVYGLHQSYEAAEMSARLGTFADAADEYVKKNGGSIEDAGAQRYAAEHVANWVKYTEMFSRTGGMDPHTGSEQLKYIKNTFQMTDEEAIAASGRMVGLGHHYGFKPPQMTSFLTTAGNAFKNFGFDIDQTMAIGQTMIKMGITPNSVGTNLTQALSYMKMPSSPKSDRAFQNALGMTHKEGDAMRRADPMAFLDKIMTGYQAAIASGDYEKQQFFANIWGSRQDRNVANMLAGWESVAPAAAFAKSLDGMKVLKDKLALLNENLQSQFKILTNGLEGLLTQVSAPWLGPLTSLTKRMQGLVNAASDWMRVGDDGKPVKDGSTTSRQQMVSYGVGGAGVLLGGRALAAVAVWGARLAGLTMISGRTTTALRLLWGGFKMFTFLDIAIGGFGMLKSLGAWVIGAGPAATRAAVGFRILGVAMRGALALGGITALLLVLEQVYTKWDLISAAASKFFTSVQNGWGRSALRSNLMWLGEKLGWIGTLFGKIYDYISKIASSAIGWMFGGKPPSTTAGASQLGGKLANLLMNGTWSDYQTNNDGALLNFKSDTQRRREELNRLLNAHAPQPGATGAQGAATGPAAQVNQAATQTGQELVQAGRQTNAALTSAGQESAGGIRAGGNEVASALQEAANAIRGAASELSSSLGGARRGSLSEAGAPAQ